MLASGDVPFVVTGRADAAREAAAGFEAAMHAVVAVLAPSGDGIGTLEWPTDDEPDPFAPIVRLCARGRDTERPHSGE